MIVDTGFDGGLSLPPEAAEKLDAGDPEVRWIGLAGGVRQRCLYYELPLEDPDGEEQLVEVLVLPGNPLLGNVFFSQMLLSIEMIEGGAVEVKKL